MEKRSDEMTTLGLVLKAVETNDLTSLKSLAVRHPDLLDRHHSMILVRAALGGDGAMLAYLLDEAQLSLDGCLVAAVSAAAKEGHIEVVRDLIRRAPGY